MRVCFVSRRYFPTISGMSVYAANLLRELVSLGHDVTMVSQYYGGVSAGVYGGGPPQGLEGVRVFGLEATNEQRDGDFEGDVREMVGVIEREHGAEPFDVIHGQYGFPTGLAAVLAGRRAGVPTVVSIQGGDGHWVGECCAAHKAAMRFVCDEADAVLIGSDSFAGEVVDRLGVARGRFTIVPGAVDTGRFSPGHGHDPGRMGVVPTLLYHGRVDRRKGVLDLLDAFERLVAAGRRVRLVVSGIGPELCEVRDRAAGLAEVTVTGHVAYECVPGVYRRADVFVSPTYAEGFSNTILEAMASGLPIVSCRAVGVVDCLEHERNALLAEVADVGDLTRQIGRMLDDAGRRRRLAAEALGECRRRYSWAAIGRQIDGVYRGLGVGVRVADELPVMGAEACRFRGEPHLL